MTKRHLSPTALLILSASPSVQAVPLTVQHALGLVCKEALGQKARTASVSERRELLRQIRLSLCETATTSSIVLYRETTSSIVLYRETTSYIVLYRVTTSCILLYQYIRPRFSSLNSLNTEGVLRRDLA